MPSLSITKQHMYTHDNVKPVEVWWLRPSCCLPRACITAAYMSAGYRPMLIPTAVAVLKLKLVFAVNIQHTDLNPDGLHSTRTVPAVL